MPTAASPQDERILEREARIVGIKDSSPPSLEAVDRRRSQLWTVAFATLVCLAVGIGLLTAGGNHNLGFANRNGFRIGTIALVIVLALYVMEKEHHLRRLAKLLVDERVLAATLSSRLKELSILYEAGKAMNSVLVVGEVLQLILSSAFELLEASSGSIMLLEGPDGLVEVCRAGNVFEDGSRLEFGKGVAERVTRDRAPLLVEGTVTEQGQLKRESTVCVPLIHRDQVLGVLSINGPAEHSYSEYDLRAVSLFAEHAAIAVANARLYEAERSSNAKLSHQAVHDALTGAANRVLISDRLVHAIARLRETDTSTAVLFIDMDNFKHVNDEFGHDAGDLILSAIAERLSEFAGASDTVGRFGGDEFVLVCEDLADDAQAMEIANRVLQELHRPFPTPFGEPTLSASIGVAIASGNRIVSADGLIREADHAMYRAKMEGKARVMVGPERQGVLSPRSTNW